jgi:hypothetical protein
MSDSSTSKLTQAEYNRLMFEPFGELRFDGCSQSFSLYDVDSTTADAGEQPTHLRCILKCRCLDAKPETLTFLDDWLSLLQGKLVPVSPFRQLRRTAIYSRPVKPTSVIVGCRPFDNYSLSDNALNVDFDYQYYTR